MNVIELHALSNASCRGCKRKMWVVKNRRGEYKHFEEFKSFDSLGKDPITEDLVPVVVYSPVRDHMCGNQHTRELGYSRLEKLIKDGQIIPATGYPENRDEFRKRGSDIDRFDFMATPCDYCDAEPGEACSSMAKGRLHGSPIKGLHKKRILATYDAHGYERVFSDDILHWILRRK